MAIQLRVPDFDIDNHDDLCNRKPSIDFLATLCQNIEGNGTIAINGKWGSGKTAFMDLLGRDLSTSFNVIKYNAWQQDITGEALPSLITSLRPKPEQAKSGTRMVYNEIRSNGIELAKKGAPILLKKVVEHAIPAGGGKVICETLAELTDEYTAEVFKRHEDYLKTLKSFQDSLTKLAESHEQEKTIILIDELDRCRPTFAIELLESCKHLFNVESILFVIAVNKSELIHVIKGVYGNDFDAEKYLERFFDYEFTLPETMHTGRIEKWLTDFGVKERVPDDKWKPTHEIISSFLNHKVIPLRKQQQIIVKLSVILHHYSDSEISKYVPALLISLIFLEEAEPNITGKILSGETTCYECLDIINTSYNGPFPRDIQLDITTWFCALETHIADTKSFHALVNKYHQRYTREIEGSTIPVEHFGQAVQHKEKEINSNKADDIHTLIYHLQCSSLITDKMVSRPSDTDSGPNIV